MGSGIGVGRPGAVEVKLVVRSAARSAITAALLAPVMSEVHEPNERPRQYRVRCDECGTKRSDYIRMHSHLRKKHVEAIGGVEWDEDETQVQCNSCGNVRTVNA